MPDKDQLKEWLAGVVAIGVGVLLSACSASAAPSNNAASVTLNPSSGSVNSTPAWSTSIACASGFQGSAIFRELHNDGTTTNSISPVVNGTAAPFHGKLQASIARIQAFGGVAKSGTQKLVVLCFSGPSLTGKSDREMTMYVKYSADGTTYTTSGTP
jgi:hypothetical protein